tara:strand:- start:4441 stop:4770 length:330 start_codon:yes stop_codon:yes gene_type:complete
MYNELNIYIAGPMRGHKNLNREAFMKAEDYLRSKRIYYTIVNPVNLDKESKMSDEELQSRDGLREVMARDISELTKCDAVYCLEGWEKSEGAKIEHALAVMLNLTIMYQ